MMPRDGVAMIARAKIAIASCSFSAARRLTCKQGAGQRILISLKHSGIHRRTCASSPCGLSMRGLGDLRCHTEAGIPSWLVNASPARAGRAVSFG